MEHQDLALMLTMDFSHGDTLVSAIICNKNLTNAKCQPEENGEGVCGKSLYPPRDSSLNVKENTGLASSGSTGL